MASFLTVRRAAKTDAHAVDSLLSEWFDWKPDSGRLDSIHRAITNREVLLAEVNNLVIGFIHYVMHEDIIDGGPNSFITAFYVSPSYRGKRLGTLLLEGAIADSLAMGAVGVETSTIHTLAKKLYERHHFKQTMGDMGEVFLELDIPEYLRSKVKGNISKD
ncbi:GNAT family N-acetyltransferase [Candidatus Bathyarchaeota archaeon]|nr:MAG: GNAT family N-acetyltransferase [Candidatus Bathyarchaeota archaeon]